MKTAKITQGGGKFLAVVMAIVMTVAMIPATAFAAVIEYSLPTTPMSMTHEATDENGNTYEYRYITSCATGYAEAAPEFLGINNVVSRSMLMMTNLEDAKTDAKAGILGTNANESPNAYIWNYYYNLYAAENGLTPVEQTEYTWTRTSSAGTDGSAIAEFGNIPFSYYIQVDIIYATTKNDTAQGYLDIVNAGKSEDDDDYYDPLYVASNTGGMIGMTQGLYEYAEAADQVIAESADENGNYTIQSRYVDGPYTYTIAQDYENISKATQYYVLSKIADNTVERKTVAVISNYDSATNTYTVRNLDPEETPSNSSAGRLADCVTACVTDICDTLAPGDTSQTITNVTAAQLLTADAILVADQNSSAYSDESIANLQAAGNTNICYTYPQQIFNCLYAQSSENNLNVVCGLSFVYPELFDYVDMMAYYAKHLWHITDASLQDMVDTTCQDVSLPAGVTSLGSISSDYEEKIEAMFAEGNAYYFANQETIDATYPNIAKYESSYLDSLATSIDTQTYTGSSITPEVAVYSQSGVPLSNDDYTVTYANNVEVGTATATITGLNEFEGQEFTVEFEVVDDKPEAKTVTGNVLNGDNRYATMCEIVYDAFDADSTDVVVLASGENYADALAAASLAGVASAPIVLTTGETISSLAAELIAYLSPQTVYVVGGTNTISETALTELQSSTTAVFERISGATRVETAQAVAAKTTALGGESKTAIIASGNVFADALSVSPYAYATNSPIFLTDGDGVLTDETLEAIQAGGYTDYLIVGGNASVSSTVESQLDGAQRLQGSTRYETSVEVAKYAVSAGVLSYDNMGIATGENFPDALAGGAYCGSAGSVLLLANDSNSAAIDLIGENADSISTINFFGGSDSVSDTLKTSILSAAGDTRVG